jgi:hypothetical protein
MKTTTFLVFVVVTAMSARADFSYSTSRKTTGGAMAAMAGGAANGTSKYYFKGQKLKVDTGATSMIMDFDAQTITTINNTQKTVSVKSFNDVTGGKPGDFTAKIDVKETGQKKTVNGFNASELMMTMEIDSPEMKQMGGKMQMEMDMWLSPDVPGAGEQRKFYEKNMAKFPWAAMAGGGGNQGMQAGMADLQRKVAEMNGVPVLEVVKIKPAGGAAAPAMPAMPQMTPEQSKQMAAAMAQMQALQKQGGAGAAAAAQMMERMQAMQGGGRAGAAPSSSLIEMTMESSDFSTASIPDAQFAIPAGYQKN